ncbi:synaptotagmin-14-like [Hydractinia symbiolongicarpus]|uniref:synaptotagmin-14-like n=1 Tax=Hydractinia symbiolongicarpus TaxID=13093 RepID=UPI002550CAF3|nr:synaptotagmin-14-like [Hydractinia symbiolongicarpus]
MSLFPLPAVLFLCFLVVLLIVLAILYFTVLKKDLCLHMEGSGDVEEGEDVIETGTVDTSAEDGKVLPAGRSTPTSVAVDGTDGAKDGEGGENGENEGGVPTVETSPEGPPAELSTEDHLTEPSLEDAPPELNLNSPANATLPGTPSDRMTLAPPAPSVAGVGDSVSTAGDPVDFIESEEPESLCIAGKILIQFTYMPAANKINLTVIRASDIPPVERGGADNIQVHLCVLPMRKQRYRTKAVPASKGVINMTFSFIHMTPDLVERCAIRLRVYSTQRFSKRLIGEVKVSLAQIDLTSPLADEQIWKNLSPKGLVDDTVGPSYNLSELSSAASFGDVTSEPELLVNLHYVDLVGRLTVEVIRAANLKKNNMLLAPDTFVKIKVVSGKGKKIGKSKTSLRNQSSDPEFNETFVYPMSPEDLKQATMMFTVFAVGRRRRKKRTIIGWFAFGLNTSGTCEANHWKEMIQNPDCDVCHWQALQTAG